jgi:glutathione S-transferase
MGAPKVKFFDWKYSPFCMKVRAILDYKSVRYERINPLGSTLLSIYRRGKIGKVPAIEIEGELIVDSTDIAYELERQFPEPPVIPTGAYDRALCHALEDWSDESLYFIGLYYRWFEREGRRAIPAAFGKSLLGQVAYQAYLRRILRQLKGQGTLRKSPGHVLRDLHRHLDAIEDLLQLNHYLLGDAPYLCDFALWGQLVYLNRTPVGAKSLAGRDVIHRFVERMTVHLANSRH